MNADQVLSLFEHAPLTVALGEVITEANQAGDEVIQEFLLEELAEAVESIQHLEACYALEAN